MRNSFKQMLEQLEKQLEIRVIEPATVEERLIVVAAEQQRRLDSHIIHSQHRTRE
jgi:hypothetical protein